MKQVKFRDLIENEVHGGLKFPNGPLISLYNGQIYPDFNEYVSYEIIEEYNSWVSLDQQVLERGESDGITT